MAASKIVDPPASSLGLVNGMIMNDPGPAASQTVVATAPNQTLAGTAANDSFVFNFKAIGSDTVTDFQPGRGFAAVRSVDLCQRTGRVRCAHDDGHGNTVVSIDAHDTITLGGVLKAQLHVGDFHVV